MIFLFPEEEGVFAGKKRGCFSLLGEAKREAEEPVKEEYEAGGKLLGESSS